MESGTAATCHPSSGEDTRSCSGSGGRAGELTAQANHWLGSRAAMLARAPLL